MCLVNELARFNKVTKHKVRFFLYRFVVFNIQKICGKGDIGWTTLFNV